MSSTLDGPLKVVQMRFTTLFIVFKPKKVSMITNLAILAKLPIHGFYVNLIILNDYCPYTIQYRE